MQDHDVVVVGAGPAGLSTAISLAQAGLRVAVIERQGQPSIAAPAPDGRDIALTNGSRQILTRLGAWQRFDAEDVAPMSAAHVLDGDSRAGLHFGVATARQEALGFLVANHVIRKALYDIAIAQPQIAFYCGQGVAGVRSDGGSAAAILDNGERVSGKLLVAADSRFSQTRTLMGIGADTVAFGKTMLVFRMAQERPHQQTAYECFKYGYTLASLPLNGLRASIVLTVPTDEATHFIDMAPDALSRLVEEAFDHRFGAMKLETGRFAYPLTGVFARRFVGKRYALAGDAAVGMHPVTAHGFNFGLLGQATLAAMIRAALTAGEDIGGDKLLLAYEARHRRATLPLFVATNAIVRLYTTDTPPARFARSALVRAAERFGPAKRLIMAQLGDRGRDVA
ncbi:MAG: 5-demethoxyubiquinol-8 5-hydroxylase UbiM [Devosia sp.]|nr:5-demethoxyubiquinol-8 5-hydroxylase UbiM [Devosia sp.]